MSAYDILTRYEGNPIIKPSDLGHLPGGCNSVFNSAVIKYGDGYKAILRIEDRAGFQTLRLADSADGINFTVGERILEPETEEQALYEEACYDPRVTKLGDTYYVCYAVESKYGCSVAMASTKDFKSFERHGVMAETENRNMVLFPERINGLYYRLDRPFQNSQGNIWLCQSPDLKHWGYPRCIMESRRFAWDRGKIGPGAPPFKVDDGWLCVYHATTPLCNNLIYRLGVAILDYERPWIVKHRAKSYILTPTADYERVGDCPNVCFVNGAIPDYENDSLRIYYAGADQVCCLATCKISELIEFCKTK